MTPLKKEKMQINALKIIKKYFCFLVSIFLFVLRMRLRESFGDFIVRTPFGVTRSISMFCERKSVAVLCLVNKQNVFNKKQFVDESNMLSKTSAS